MRERTGEREGHGGDGSGRYFGVLADDGCMGDGLCDGAVKGESVGCRMNARKGCRAGPEGVWAEGVCEGERRRSVRGEVEIEGRRAAVSAVG